MVYTNLWLMGFASIGILLHILVEVSKLNKQPNGNFSLKGYLKLEIYNILISLLVSLVCVFASQEIKQLQTIGNWLGLAYLAIGYMGQSLLIAFMGKAQKIVDSKLDNPDATITTKESNQ